MDWGILNECSSVQCEGLVLFCSVLGKKQMQEFLKWALEKGRVQGLSWDVNFNS